MNINKIKIIQNGKKIINGGERQKIKNGGYYIENIKNWWNKLVLPNMFPKERLLKKSPLETTLINTLFNHQYFGNKKQNMMKVKIKKIKK